MPNIEILGVDEYTYKKLLTRIKNIFKDTIHEDKYVVTFIESIVLDGKGKRRSLIRYYYSGREEDYSDLIMGRLEGLGMVIEKVHLDGLRGEKDLKRNEIRI